MCDSRLDVVAEFYDVNDSNLSSKNRRTEETQKSGTTQIEYLCDLLRSLWSQSSPEHGTSPELPPRLALNHFLHLHD